MAKPEQPRNGGGAGLRLLRQTVAPQLAKVYPQFAAEVFGVIAGY